MKAYAQDVERLVSEQGILLDDTEESLERVDLLLHKIAGDTVLTPKMPEEASQLWGVGQDIRRISRRGRDSQHERAWELQHNPDGTARVVLILRGVKDVPVRQSLQPTDRGSVFQRLRPLPRAAGHHQPLQAVRIKSILSGRAARALDSWAPLIAMFHGRISSGTRRRLPKNAGLPDD